MTSGNVGTIQARNCRVPPGFHDGARVQNVWTRRGEAVKESFWDNVADRYDDEIFNTLTSDKSQTLAKTVRKYATGVDVACDFGCGVGRFVPLLASCAQRVIATDFSARSLELAKATIEHRSQAKVVFKKHDLAKTKPRIGKANLGLCINVMIMPQLEHRQRILKNVRRNLAPAGRLILAVPSLESTIYSLQRLLEWHRREGDNRQSTLKRLEQETRKTAPSIIDGILEIQGEPTKHYLREELLLLFDQHKLEVLEELRIEYEWQEDFEEPPKWMKAPWPWDWLFVLEKR